MFSFLSSTSQVRQEAARRVLLTTLFFGLAPLTRVIAAPPSVAIAPIPSAPATTPQQKSLLIQMQDAFTHIAQSVEPTVVNIKSERLSPSNLLNPDQGTGPLSPGTPPKSGLPFSSPRGPLLPQTPRRSQATGSGVIVRADGYILTNDHVVDGANDGIVTVTLSDGREFRGKVYADYRSDLAIVKIDPADTTLPVATFADSDAVEPGQWAIAVGSPFDLQNTVTVGIISATGRHQSIPGETPGQERYYPDLLQTDAAINPGNSGGPLFNIDGQVVGINVAIESPVEGSSGVGFAIPSGIAQQVMNSLITQGKVIRGYLGLAPDDLTPTLQQQFGQRDGAFIRDVSLSSPAGKAGLHAGDIVTEYAGKPIKSEIALRTAISVTAPGTTVTITYVRDGHPTQAMVTVGTAPAQGTQTPAVPSITVPKTKLGISVRELTAHDRQAIALPPDTTGVYIVSVTPGSAAESTEFSTPIDLEGAIIQKIGKTTITNKTDFEQATTSLVPGTSLTLLILYAVDSALHQSAITIRL